MWLASCSEQRMKRALDILLVEDDPVLGPLTAESLVTCGHHVTLSPTTRKAFEELKAPHRFDVVILDIQLGADRAENLVDRLKSAGVAFPAVVLFSAQPSSEIARAARTVNASGALQKPCTVEQIDRMLERVVA
jgi:DNA-binding NtrC family response regulator